MSNRPSYTTEKLFDLDIFKVTFPEAVDLLAEAAAQRNGRAGVVVTPNVDHLVRLEHATPAFRAAYRGVDYIFADGMPVVWASRLLGKPLPERVTGADLFVALCRRAVAENLTVLVVGGMPGTEAALSARFESVYPGIVVHILCPSMSFDPAGSEGEAAADKARAVSADIVFVCVGMAKQENWAFKHAPELGGGIVLCVGAAMDFALGYKSRAPRWVQRAGMEWIWRLASDPKRLWRRYLVEDPKFAKLCWQEWRRTRQGN